MKNMNRISILRDRAYMLRQTRDFFLKKGIVEVDCPVLNTFADISTHIDLIPAIYGKKNPCYLSPSPEYGMKKLLSEGIGDIYQLSHVFRDEEVSCKHNPEFTLIEWYRMGMCFEDLIEETIELIKLFLGNLPHHILSYRHALMEYAGIDYTKMNPSDLLKFIENKNITTYEGIEKESKDNLLNLILANIEPYLGQTGLCALTDYPASQAALAKLKNKENEIVAERFEIYHHGIELCNGYHELTDPEEQRKRILESNKQRSELGKQSLPVDEEFLKALEKGIPNCVGVAVGFDRLMMLRHQTSEISDILPFTWNNSLQIEPALIN